MSTTPPHPAVRDQHAAVLLPPIDHTAHGFFLWHHSEHGWTVAPVTLHEVPFSTVGPVVHERGFDVQLGSAFEQVRQGVPTTVQRTPNTREDTTS